MIPGIDGVGRRPDGRRIYFVADDEVRGTMAEKALIDKRRSIELPEEVDAATVAATMNPAMSAWVALRLRVPLQPGQSVLVLGATGNAGTMAIQVAKLLGAGRVVGAGRDPAPTEWRSPPSALTRWSAWLTMSKPPTRALADAAADVDIVIDYLWGKPAQHAIMALLTARTTAARS